MAGIRKNNGLIDPKKFGADESSPDNTQAIQDAIDAAYEKNLPVIFTGMFDCQDHLYIYGNVALKAANIGDGLRLTASPSNNFYWIIAGTKSFGATTANGLIDTWTGYIEGVTFKSTVPGSTNIAESHIRAINLMSYQDVAIRDSVFDFTEIANSGMGAVGRYNNANFLNGSSVQNGSVVSSCIAKIGPSASTSEAFGFSTCSNVSVANCTVRNFGDDVVAVHKVEGFAISDNDLETVDGRILAESSRRGSISDNTIKRIDTPSGTVSGGSMIYIFNLLGDDSAQVCSDISVTGNTIVHANNLTSATYGLRVAGSKRIKIDSNFVQNCGSFGYGVTWEGQQMPPAWTDPEGVEADTIARIRDLQVRDNFAPGTTVMGGLGAEIPGPVSSSGNFPIPSNITSSGSENPVEVNGHEISVDGSGRLVIDGVVVGGQS